MKKVNETDRICEIKTIGEIMDTYFFKNNKANTSSEKVINTKKKNQNGWCK